MAISSDVSVVDPSDGVFVLAVCARAAGILPAPMITKIIPTTMIPNRALRIWRFDLGVFHLS
jgi:hypothetical protein